MKQSIFLLIAVLGIVILSCGEDDIGYATITVHNQSNYDVTDIIIAAVGVDSPGNYPTLSLLKEGETHRFDAEWIGGARGSGSFLYIIEYYIDGNKFGVEHQEDKIWDDSRSRYVSPQTISNGAVAEIFIKNESYELVIHKGAVAWSEKD